MFIYIADRIEPLAPAPSQKYNLPTPHFFFFRKKVSRLTDQHGPLVMGAPKEKNEGELTRKSQFVGHWPFKSTRVSSLKNFKWHIKLLELYTNDSRFFSSKSTSVRFDFKKGKKKILKSIEFDRFDEPGRRSRSSIFVRECVDDGAHLLHGHHIRNEL